MVRAAILFVAVAALSRVATAGMAEVANPDAAPRYDPVKFTRTSGTIVDIRDVGAPSALRGIFVTIRADKRDLEVYLCPPEFLKRFELTLHRGDTLQLSGSRVKFGGGDLLLTREMRRHTDILVLRDEDGNPYWNELTDP